MVASNRARSPKHPETRGTGRNHGIDHDYDPAYCKYMISFYIPIYSIYNLVSLEQQLYHVSGKGVRSTPS